MNEENLKETVREKYGSIAESNSSCCDSARSCCCGPGVTYDASGPLYSASDLAAVPGGADLGLGCGNPAALAAIEPGDVVLDLGSGAGIDCFLAAKMTGQSGMVMGVDMTPEMIAQARKIAAESGYGNVEFRLGEIELLPVETETVDLIISNCVINLVPDKQRAFREMYRVLKSGGRIMISDIVVTADMPAAIRESLEAYAGCVAGAESKDRYLDHITEAGFAGVSIDDEHQFLAAAGNPRELIKSFTGIDLTDGELERLIPSIVSITVSATKS